MATFSSGVKCFRSFLIRSLRYLNGRTLSPFPAEAGQLHLKTKRISDGSAPAMDFYSHCTHPLPRICFCCEVRHHTPVGVIAGVNDFESRTRLHRVNHVPSVFYVVHVSPRCIRVRQRTWPDFRGCYC